MKNIAFKNMKTRMSITFAAILICCAGAMAQSKTLASVIDEAIEFGRTFAAGQNVFHFVYVDFSIQEGAHNIRNVSPASFYVGKKKHQLGFKEYLECAPDRYVYGTNTNSAIAGTPKITISNPSHTYVISTNSSLVTNPALVDLLTISYKTASGTTKIGMRNSATVTEGNMTSSNIDGQVKSYIISDTVNGKVVRVQIRLIRSADG